MSKYVFDMTFTVRADSIEEALEILMSATAGVELYDGGDKVEVHLRRWWRGSGGSMKGMNKEVAAFILSRMADTLLDVHIDIGDIRHSAAMLGNIEALSPKEQEHIYTTTKSIDDQVRNLELFIESLNEVED